MTTVREYYLQVLFNKVTELNGENTEEDLNMVITENILKDRIERANSGDRGALVLEKLDSMIDTEKEEKNGAYVYSDSSIENLIFDRYNTIADAVRNAIKIIDAKIICNGDIITYDTLDDETAYYIDDRLGKVMLVDLK